MRTKEEIIKARETLDMSNDVDIEIDKYLAWVLSDDEKAEASHAVLSEVRAIINNMRDNKKLCG